QRLRDEQGRYDRARHDVATQALPAVRRQPGEDRQPGPELVPTVRLGGSGRERAVQACLGAAAALPQPVGVTAVGGEVCDTPPADAGRRDQRC
ncbi:MAG TPA: hypothetical protein VK875_00615, partial [Euzebyales bacterium]|nr:hypothetical protein [Euzebyales bacterium]